MHDHKGNLTVGLDDYIYSPKFVERVKEDIERAWMIEGEVEPDFSTHPSYEYHQKFGWKIREHRSNLAVTSPLPTSTGVNRQFDSV